MTMQDGISRSSQILWVDSDIELLKKAEQIFKKFEFNFVGTSSFSQAVESIRAEAFSLIIVDQQVQNSRGMELLERAREISPHTIRVLIAEKIDINPLVEAVNRGSIFRFVTKPWTAETLVNVVQSSLEHHQLRSAQDQVRKEIGLQNKRLQELTSRLEEIVTERTLRAEQSRHEAEEKLQRVRELVRFIKDLAASGSVEDLMTLVAKEIRHFHDLAHPVLAFVGPEQRPQVLAFQGKQLIAKMVSQMWPSGSRLRMNELTDRQYLANTFGRPFVKVVAIPLRNRSFSEESQFESPPTLFLEHASSEQRIDRFLEFMAERLQPLGLAIDRILLEDNLKSISMQWESTFDGIADPIAIVDIEYNVVRANRSFSGKSFEHQCHQLFADSESLCRGCPVANALESGQPQMGVVRRGKQVFEVHSYPIRLSRDQVSRNVINHYVDVTLARELQGRVIQNEKMSAIGLLAGNIAHELNNPLTGIRSLAQVLRHDSTLPTAVESDLSEVERAAERCQKIIENLLDFSKTEASNSLQPIELNELVRRTLPMLKTVMREHRSEIELSEGTTRVYVEPQLMQQVVFNLINNACQSIHESHSIDGLVRVITGTGEPFGGSNQVWLMIEDNGGGIAHDLHEAIFEPFFTTKAPNEGTGLGLSMSREVVKKFGGEISVQSESGRGAKFLVLLPLIQTQVSS